MLAVHRAERVLDVNEDAHQVLQVWQAWWNCGRAQVIDKWMT
jgi:hypothetical protein